MLVREMRRPTLGDHGTMVILIAEDAPIDAIIIRNIVEHAGHRAIVVRSGREALDALDEHPEVAAVVADVRMPEMGGVELLREMRGRPEFEDVPVVFVSAAADADTVKEAVSLRPAGYILKPVTEPSRVLDRVDHALRQVRPALSDHDDADRQAARQVLAAALRATLEPAAQPPAGESDSESDAGVGTTPPSKDALRELARSAGALRLAEALANGEPNGPRAAREMRAVLNLIAGRA